MGPKNDSKYYKSSWSKEKPTRGYCYVVTQFIVNYLCSEAETYKLIVNVDDDIEEVHWFCKIKNKIVDLTADQYSYKLDYSEAMRRCIYLESNYCKEFAKLYYKYNNKNVYK